MTSPKEIAIARKLGRSTVVASVMGAVSTMAIGVFLSACGGSTASTASTAGADDAPLSLNEVERRHIAAVLQRAHWHQGKAAQLLGISAKTLYRKIREYDFERPPGLAL